MVKDETMESRVADLFSFIRERHAIWRRKARGDSKPWTQDVILQKYRFCNVLRELDTVTRWIATNWREPHKNDKDLWFAMAVARFFNWPPTLEAIGYPVPFDKRSMYESLRKRTQTGEQVFTGAYIVSTNGNKMDKISYVLDCVLAPLWKGKKQFEYILGRNTTLSNFHQNLMAFQGMGSFMAAQVIADLKYVQPLIGASDWRTWAASGPGSRRGLRYVLNGGDIERNVSWVESDWLMSLHRLHDRINELRLKDRSVPYVHAQDLQNCLCEFSKYVRVQQGTGRPRSTYDGV